LMCVFQKKGSSRSYEKVTLSLVEKTVQRSTRLSSVLEKKKVHREVLHKVEMPFASLSSNQTNTFTLVLPNTWPSITTPNNLLSIEHYLKISLSHSISLSTSMNLPFIVVQTPRGSYIRRPPPQNDLAMNSAAQPSPTMGPSASSWRTGLLSNAPHPNINLEPEDPPVQKKKAPTEAPPEQKKKAPPEDTPDPARKQKAPTEAPSEQKKKTPTDRLRLQNKRQHSLASFTRPSVHGADTEKALPTPEDAKRRTRYSMIHTDFAGSIEVDARRSALSEHAPSPSPAPS